VQIIDPREEETHYWGEVEAGLRAIDIWIGEEKNRGKGWGARIMQLAIARCFNNPFVRGILLDPLVSNTRAIRFYEKLGFRKIGLQRFGEDDCQVMRLDKPVNS
jgi:aminoglycoside 6'-N-acetyltransferase